MQSTTIISDSSFYICFLDDINMPHLLLKVIKSNNFSFIVGYIIKEEVKKSTNFYKVSEVFESDIVVFSYYNYGEIIRTFLSIEEVRKGEHEVIVISYILNSLSLIFKVIIDDDSPKRFLIRMFPELRENVTGTVGFVESCTIDYKVFSRQEAITILKAIKSSRFRVNNEIIDKVIARVEKAVE